MQDWVYWSFGALGLAGFGALLTVRARTERIGPFEVRSHVRSYTTGWNEGRLRRRKTTHYSVHFRGQMISFEGPLNNYSGETVVYGKRVNAVLSFAVQPQTLVINVGDGNNSSYYYLLREVDDRVQVELLTEDRRGVTWAVLDAPRRAGKREFVVRRQHYQSGSLLQLEDETVLDLQGLNVHRFTEARDPGVNHFAEPLGAAPDRRSALHISFAERGRYQLLITDFVADQLQRVEIDRARMRFLHWHQIDQAWVDHHYQWLPDQLGRLRLQARADFTPLPYRGQLRRGVMDYPGYELLPVRPSIHPVLLEFLAERFRAESMPFDKEAENRALSEPEAATERNLRIGDEVINLRFSGYSVATLTLRSEHASGDALIPQLAQAIDAELASGRWDRHFSEADLPWPYSQPR